MVSAVSFTEHDREFHRVTCSNLLEVLRRITHNSKQPVYAVLEEFQGRLQELARNLHLDIVKSYKLLARLEQVEELITKPKDNAGKLPYKLHYVTAREYNVLIMM